MPNSVEELASKIDTSLGLLTNVPKAILDNLGYKFNVGKEENIIEVTILYRDTPENMKSVVESLGGVFEDLGFNFGIVDLPLDKLDDLARSKSVQYIELPKNLHEADAASNTASCVSEVVSNYIVSG